MVTIDGDIADLIEQHITGGNIRAADHPTAPWRILNYTPQVQYGRLWDEATRICRGLIVDDEWQIIARPFPKFHNWGELDGPEQERLIFIPPARIADKLDGSLGIIYRDIDGHPSVATRGSFTSEQAAWATTWVRRHMPDLTWPEDTTPLAEIIYPANRIVVDYDFEGLAYLDTLYNSTGLSVELVTGEDPVLADWLAHDAEWAPTFPPSRLTDILAGEGPLPDDGTAEGYVVTWPDGTRCKLKLGEYVRLHRIVTGVNARHIWELLANAEPGKTDEALAPILDRVPDEFYGWAAEWAARLLDAVTEIHRQIHEDWTRIVSTVGREDRKAFALEATKTKHPAALFAHLDGRHDKVDRYVWQRVKPEAETPFRQDIDA